MNKYKKRKFTFDKETLLHIALENKLDKIGELLISKGADINAKDIIYQVINNHFLSFGNKLKKEI